MKDIFIYALIDPLTKKIRYVGKSVNPYKRYKQHTKIIENAKRRKDRWINKLLNNNMKPLIIILETAQTYNWQECERKWIMFCRKDGCDLTNHTDGGDGVHNPDIEARHRLSNARKKLFEDDTYRQWYTKNIAQNPERCRKISRALKGKKKTKEHIKKLPQNNIGYVHKDGFGEKISKSVSGDNNPMYGNHFSKIWIEKYGKEVAKHMLKEHYEKCGNKQKGKTQKCQYDLWLEKYGKDEADNRQIKTNEKRKLSLEGIKRSTKTKQKMRDARKKWWENKRKTHLTSI